MTEQEMWREAVFKRRNELFTATVKKAPCTTFRYSALSMGGFRPSDKVSFDDVFQTCGRPLSDDHKTKFGKYPQKDQEDPGYVA